MLLQRQTISIQSTTTAHLAQTMTLLALNAAELSQKIDSALAANPALELRTEHRCPICRRVLSSEGRCPICSRPENIGAGDPIVHLSPMRDFYERGRSRSNIEELPEVQDLAEIQSLPEYVLQQIAADLAGADRPIAAHLLTSLDEDGLLEGSILEIARYHHVLPSRVEAVLRLIQHAEPIGVGSPSPQAALLVQLEILRERRAIPAMTEQAIREGMNLLSRHRYPELGQLLNISTGEAKQIAAFISENLNPFPARAHWGDIRQGGEAPSDSYRYPDIIVSKLSAGDDSPLVVEVATPCASGLRINPLFRQALQEAPPEKSEQWNQDLEQALLLVKCLQQRNQAIVMLMQKLASSQRAFILQGEAYLKPLTRAALADELGVHESTISRAVSHKSVQLPNGHIIPLSKFFDISLQVRTVLKTIIANEGRTLSDNELVKHLDQRGYHIARRTVAKYRAMEGILPARLRQ